MISIVHLSLITLIILAQYCIFINYFDHSCSISIVYLSINLIILAQYRSFINHFDHSSSLSTSTCIVHLSNFNHFDHSRSVSFIYQSFCSFSLSSVQLLITLIILAQYRPFIIYFNHFRSVLFI